VSVIDTITNKVIATIPIGSNPFGVAVTPGGSKLYVLHIHCITGCPLSVIDTATNKLITEISGGGCVPNGCYQFSSAVAVAPDGSKVYAVAFPYCECSPEVVLVINTATNTVIGTIPLPSSSTGFAYDKGLSVTPDGSKVYVVSNGYDTVSVVDTTTNAVTATIPVGGEPIAWGIFIPIPVPQTVPIAGNFCPEFTKAPSTAT
jgi:YVTN family beta-propeller protein